MKSLQIKPPGSKSTGTRIPRPKAKAKSLNLFGKTSSPKGSSSYKKSQLQDDPTKFGNFGYDINQLTPNIVQRGSPWGFK